MNLFGYNRIIIVGNNGSGKSFLSKELSVITSLPLVHLDVEFWRPNWEKPPKEEWIKKQTELFNPIRATLFYKDTNRTIQSEQI